MEVVGGGNIGMCGGVGGEMVWVVRWCWEDERTRCVLRVDFVWGRHEW